MSQTSDENSRNEFDAQQINTVSRSNPIKSSMLRPSALQSGLAAATSSLDAPKTSLLRPAAFQATSSSNPFLAMVNNSPEADNEAQPKQAENGSTEKKPEEKSMNSLQKSNLFAPSKSTISTSSDNSGFVFGQNVHERVTGESVQNECTSSGDSSANQLFAIAGSSSSSDPISATVTASVESLNEVARVYEESRAQKRKYEEVETFTGEEDETNVLDVTCKLFAFVASNWEERGPGNLRVNDSKDKSKSPRVVFRTSGNLRVLLNTKVWPGMVVQRPSQKSLRLTAIDSAGQIKVFLAMARPEDIAKLYVQLTNRIDFEKGRPTPVKVSDPAAISTTSTTIIDDDDVPIVETVAVEDDNEADSLIPKKKVAIDNSRTEQVSNNPQVGTLITPTITTTAADDSNHDG